MPAGRMGMAPALNLNYSASNPGGPLGLGWRLELGYIERSTKEGFPKYNSNDKFIFSLGGAGSELVYVEGNTYQPKHDPQNYKFIFDGAYWKAKDKLGRTYYFGDQYNSPSVEQNGNLIFRWYLVKVEDMQGNYMAIEYASGQGGVPSKIYYTRHPTNPAGSPIVSTGGSTNPNDLKYLQFKVEMISADAPNYAEFPYLYYANSYVVKFDYYKVQTNAEITVELVYRTGFRNFDLPLQDKIFKKVISVHEKAGIGQAGYFDLSYDIDDGDGTSYTFSNIDLSLYPHRYESFFPDTAFGRNIRFRWYKNDIYDFKIKQIGVVMTSEPII